MRQHATTTTRPAAQAGRPRGPERGLACAARVAVAAALIACVPASASAAAKERRIVVLTNGQRIEVSRAWQEEGRYRLELPDGGSLVIPASLVRRVSQNASDLPTNRTQVVAASRGAPAGSSSGPAPRLPSPATPRRPGVEGVRGADVVSPVALEALRGHARRANAASAADAPLGPADGADATDPGILRGPAARTAGSVPAAQTQRAEDIRRRLGVSNDPREATRTMRRVAPSPRAGVRPPAGVHRQP